MNMIKIRQMARQMAEHEVGWWKAHHRKQREALINEMTNLYRLLFDLSYDCASNIVKHRVKAAELHDIAEEHENHGRQEEADKYWNETQMALQKHFELLEKFRKR